MKTLNIIISWICMGLFATIVIIVVLLISPILFVLFVSQTVYEGVLHLLYRNPGLPVAELVNTHGLELTNLEILDWIEVSPCVKDGRGRVWVPYETAIRCQQPNRKWTYKWGALNLAVRSVNGHQGPIVCEDNVH